MDLSSGVSLGTLLVTIGGVLVTGGIAWGSLLQRVQTLEKEVATLTGFGERLARIEEGQKHMNCVLNKITGSWLFKEPPGYAPIRAPRAK